MTVAPLPILTGLALACLTLAVLYWRERRAMAHCRREVARLSQANRDLTEAKASMEKRLGGSILRLMRENEAMTDAMASQWGRKHVVEPTDSQIVQAYEKLAGPPVRTFSGSNHPQD